MPFDPFARVPPNANKLRPGPQNFSNYVAYGQPLPGPNAPWSIQNAICNGLEVCSWVFACIDMRAKGVSSVPWIVQRRVGRAYNSKTWERVYNHPLEVLLENPNNRMTRKFLMHYQSMLLDVGGNALFKKVVDGLGATFELWPLNAARAAPLPDEQWIGGYRIMNTGGNGFPTGGWYDLPWDLVIHAMRPNPGNPFWGLAPLQVLAGVVEMDLAMERSNRKLALSNNMPAAVISDKGLDTPLKLTMAQDAMDARWGVDMQGKPLVLPAGANFLRLALTPQETDYLASRKWNVSQICAPFDILPSVFEPAAATYANLSASIEYMWESGIIPQLELLGDSFNLALISEAERDNLCIVPDLSNIKALKVQFTRAVADFRALVQTGVPPQVANDRVGLYLPRYTDDDKPYREGRWLSDDAQGNLQQPDAPLVEGGVANPNLTAASPIKLPPPNNPSSSANPPTSGKSLLAPLPDLVKPQ